ncbi:MAG: hypothetical protein OER97_01400 [Gammaproteobacteria bacterium]|nr:hypothetical protein [Gammaproteobacteria bacterium]
MSGRYKLATLLPGILFAICAAAFAADDEVPELEFLEYLGMWEESDEEWLVFDEQVEQTAVESDERIDPVPEGKESMEKDDES